MCVTNDMSAIVCGMQFELSLLQCTKPDFFMVVVVSFFVYLYLLVSHFFGASLSPTSFAPKSHCPQHADGVRSVNLSCCNSSFLIFSSVCKICLSMDATFIVTFFIQQGYNQYEHLCTGSFFLSFSTVQTPNWTLTLPPTGLGWTGRRGR